MNNNNHKLEYNQVFTFQTWITTFFLAPIIIAVADSIFFKDLKMLSNIGSAILLIPFGIVLSLPALLQIWLFFKFFASKRTQPLHAKVFLLLITIATIWITFKLIDGFIFISYATYYTISSLISFSIFKITHS